MKKRKSLSQIFLAVLAASTLAATPAWAEGAVNTARQAAEVEQPAFSKQMEQALERVYKVFPELKQLTLRHKFYSPGGDGRPAAWSIAFDNRPNDPKTEDSLKYTNAFVNLNAETGELMHMNIQNPDWASGESPSEELSKEKAASFVKQVLGDKVKDFRAEDTLFYGKSGVRAADGKQLEWAHATVRYERLVNGIPFKNSGFSVNVDSAGRVVGFDQNERIAWDFSKFPDPKQAISKEEAEQAYVKLLDMKLMYNGHQPIGSKPFVDKAETRPVLMYLPIFEGVLDAQTGNLAEFGMRPAQSNLSKKVAVSPTGETLVVKSKEEAEKLLSDVFGIDMNEMQFDQREETDWPSGKKFHHYSWHSKPVKESDGRSNYDQMRYVHLGIDAETGEVLTMNLQDESMRGKQAKVSQTDAEKTAIQFLERYISPKHKELSLQHVFSTMEDAENIPNWVDKNKLQDQKQSPEYHFSFHALHQGVPVMDRSFSVQVDGVTGKVAGFALQSAAVEDEVKLPDNQNVVSVESAKQEFLRQHPLQLVYIWPDYRGQIAPEPVLVYIPADTAVFEYIDAFSGKTMR
ncbi:YcdB/YcdC domain-containing protein [Effusibacillus lacus]|uniref:YcdB/YcdC repeated domain-containing protein n=1 Tax=Effusibacillus lacus TaxID=1348429 RepID=A0A292YE02_9BACL|nr:YcdB/YcdC domain-containing protein [Effusibacillus lacus]TCS74171.1 hypothetical protein EDD64_11525 [Effusibacillus lacus]GAX90832.1 hypothetical protein EFBL_2474 [Effusibacillus lacus]